MDESTRAQAESASFQAFINCYLREVCGGVWMDATEVRDLTSVSAITWRGSQGLQLYLPGQKLTLVLDVTYRSLVGRHQIAAVYRRSEGGLKREGFWGALMTLVRELFDHQQLVADAVSKRRQLELTWRLTDSLQNMARYLAHWQAQPSAGRTGFLVAEQALVYGHWLHPTPKSRQGCLDWQQPLFSPELQGRFQLHGFAVDRSLLSHASNRPESAEDIVLSLFSDVASHCRADEAFIPVHPLQAHWLLFQPALKALLDDGRIRHLGVCGPWFSATSSMRTVYHPDLPWMLKLSIPVKLTNSLRQNKAHELQAGVLVNRLLQTLGFDELQLPFRIIADPAWLSIDIPGQRESGFECILRCNPFCNGQNLQVMPVAGLVQDPVNPGEASVLKQLVISLATARQQTESEAALQWFDHYWQCAIEPCIKLFDQFGIALEAHQQNMLLDIANGAPSLCYFRDNQGFYLCESRRKALVSRLPALAQCDGVFYPDAMIIQRFGYYLIINQLFAVMHRMGKDQLVPESTLLRLVINRLRLLLPTLSDLGEQFVHYLLTSETLACKANLLTRVKDIDELEADQEMAVYLPHPNPIAAATCQISPQREREYA